MNSFAFSLSMPPSANMMFATDFKTKRRFVSKEYKAWKALEGPQLTNNWRRAGSPKFVRPIMLTIHLGLNYQSDVDNRIKPILDLLSAIPDFPNDRYIDRLEVERIPEIQGARVFIMQLGGGQ
jgi:Holliday junction resolvase RusA-like endonuclease